MKKFYRVALTIVLLLSVMLTFIISSSAEVTGVSSLHSNDFSSKVGVTLTGTNKANYDAVLADGADGGKYLRFSPNTEFTSTNGDFIYFGISNTSFTSTGADTDAAYYVMDFDICTDGKFFPKTRIQFAARTSKLVGGNNVYIVNDETTGVAHLQDTNGNNLAVIDNGHGAWTHFTVVFDVELNTDTDTSASANTVAHYYVNGEHVHSVTAWTGAPTTLPHVRIIPDKSGTVVNSDYSICFDNVSFKKYSLASNTNLGDIISDTTKTLDEFDDSIYTTDYAFPKATAIASIGDTKFGSYREVYEAANEGDTLVLLKSLNETFIPKCSMSVDTNGFAFKYDAEGFDVTEGEGTVAFTKNFADQTVTWHIGDEVVTEVYTSPEVATYKGEYDEYITVDGVQYKAAGFAKSEGGEALESLGVVSEKNCEFWLVYVKPVASLLRSGVTSYLYSLTELDALVAAPTKNDYITLLEDVTLGSTVDSGSFSLKTAITIDLNGYTLSNKTGATSHLFVLNSAAANLTLTSTNGKGKIAIKSKNLIYCNYAATAKIENAVFNAVYILSEFRNGTLIYENCDIDNTNINNTIAVMRPNSSATAPTTVKFVDCNLKTNEYAVSVGSRAGTNEYSSVIFENCIVEANHLVNAVYCKTLTLNNTSVTAKSLLYGMTLDTTLNIDGKTSLDVKSISNVEYDALTINVEEGYALAKTGNADKPYTVTDKFHTIIWKSGTKEVVEAYLDGVMPTCPFDIPEDDKTAIFNMEEITVATEDKTYTVSVKPAFKLRMNIAIGSNMTVYIYIPDGVSFSGASLGGVNYAEGGVERVLVDGVPYSRVAYEGYAILESGKRIDGNIALVASNGASFDYAFSVSIPEYLKSIIEGGSDYDTKLLAASVANLLDKAYVYMGMTEDESYRDIEELMLAVDEKKIELPYEVGEWNTDGISDVVRGASLTIGKNMSVRFYFREGASGTLRFTYSKDGESVTDQLTLSDGVADGLAYHDVVLSPYDFAGNIEIKTGALDEAKYGSYNMMAYMDKVRGGDPKFDAFLDAVYSYSQYAKNYKNGSTDLGSLDGSIEAIETEGDSINITASGYKVVALGNSDVLLSLSNLLFRIDTFTGVRLEYAKTLNEAGIVFEVEELEYANSVIGRYIIKVENGVIYVKASSAEAFGMAKARLLSFVTDEGIVIPVDFSEDVMYNLCDFMENEDVVYSEAELQNLALLTGIKVGGKDIADFSPYTGEYEVDSRSAIYPTVTATPAVAGASLLITQASEDNGGVATITVTNGDGTMTYNVKINTRTSPVEAEVVNKNGAKGTVTFVVDDGYKPTANFMKSMIEKYSKLAVSYAIKTKTLLSTDAQYDDGLIVDDIDGDGMLEYVLDENGKYTYVRDESAINFWNEILSAGRSEVVAHSHTHAFWGVNDNGGAQLTASTAGDISTRIQTTLVEGSASKEVYAAMQIIQDIFGDTYGGLTYVNAGIPPKEGDTPVEENVSVYISNQTVRVLYDTRVTVTDGNVYLADLTWVDLQSTTGTLPANSVVVTTADVSSGVIPAGTPIYLSSHYVTVPTLDHDGNPNVVKGFKSFIIDIYRQAYEDGTVIGGRTSGQKVYTAKDFLDIENRILRRAYIIATSTNEARPESWKTHIDNAIAADGGWASFCIHAMTEDISEEGQGGHKITWEQAEDLFKYACDKGDDLWIATQTEATLYYHQWSTSTVKATLHGDGEISVLLTDEETDERYNAALTVKLSIPESWTGATAYGEALTIHGEGEDRYVYVDVRPDEPTTVKASGYDCTDDTVTEPVIEIGSVASIPEAMLDDKKYGTVKA